MAEPKRPNFLIFMCDQLSAFALGCYGNQVVKSPNIDRLASDGVIFDSNYCNYPLCVPSRASMMAGQLASKFGSWDSGGEFPACVPTLAHHLRAAGYYTCLSGKMHFIGPDQLHGFEDRVTTELYPADFSWTYNWDFNGRKYGFETKTEAGFTDIRSVADSGIADWCMQMEHDEEVFFEGQRKLRNLCRPGDDRPWLLTMSFTQPHDPYIAKQKYWDLYDHDQIDLPKLSMPPYDELDERMQMVYKLMKQDIYELSDEDIRTARHAYYAMISDLDDKLGEVRAELEQLGLADNTVIIFTADHGDMLGERGMWYKNCFYEPSVRVPLIIFDPRQKQGRRVAANTSLVDLLPTLVSLAGSDTTADFRETLDGNDLSPLLNGDASNWPDVVYSEIHDNRTVCSRLMVRKGAYKYEWSPTYAPVLFDLDRDPEELINQAGNPEYAAIEAELKALIFAKWDAEHITQECILRQKERRLITDALTQGRWTAWEIGKTDVTADHQYMRFGDMFPQIDHKNYVNRRK